MTYMLGANKYKQIQINPQATENLYMFTLNNVYHTLRLRAHFSKVK